MAPNSLVECIETPQLNLLLTILILSAGCDSPVKGEIYTVEDIKRCQCGEHDNLFLSELPGKGWADRYFKEIQPPSPLIISETMEAQEPIVKILETETI